MMKSIEKVDMRSGTKVLVRCDLDVPLIDGRIQDTFRLDHLLPTLNFLKQKQAKIIIMGHIDRPEGTYVDELSTTHLNNYFIEKLGLGGFELLENLRFDPREEENSEGFAEELSKKADIYINESFGNCHREHTSIVGVPKILESYAGFRLLEELDNLGKVLGNPERPFIAIVGGAKVETKKPLVDKFIQIADQVLVGGKIGLNWGEVVSKKLYLPVDYLGDNKDIGKKTVSEYKSCIGLAKTVVWSGPLGMFEDGNFSRGTEEIAKAISNSDGFTLIGGGDTIAAVKRNGLLDSFSFVSTGGSAMLEFLVKGNLPGLEVLGFNG